MLTGYAFLIRLPLLKYILLVLIKKFINKKAAWEKICSKPSENTCEGPIAGEIYYVWLTIRHMKFSRTSKFRTMFLEQLSVFLNSQPTVRVTIWYQLFLEFWLVHTWIFAHWRYQLAVTRLENVRQLNERWGKKLDINLLHRQPLKETELLFTLPTQDIKFRFFDNKNFIGLFNDSEASIDGR